MRFASNGETIGQSSTQSDRTQDLLRQSNGGLPWATWSTPSLLVGRESEINTLNEAYDLAASGRKVMVAIGGQSGTGKSTLVRTQCDRWLQELATQNGASPDDDDESLRLVVGTGKFQRVDAKKQRTSSSSSLQPLSAVVDCVQELVEQWRKSSTPRNEADLQRHLRKDELLLRSIFPTFFQDDDRNRETEYPASIADVEIASTDAYSVTLESWTAMTASDTSGQLALAIWKLIGFFCRSTTPIDGNRSSRRRHQIVLFLDDIQWADDASRGVLKAFGKAADLEGILLVVAYRSEEVEVGDAYDSTNHHPIARVLMELRDGHTDAPFDSKFISVDNFNALQVRTLIAKILKQDEEDVSYLSQVVFDKTGGNAFFVLRFLELLQDEGFLTYSLTKLTWEWGDEDSIHTMTTVSTNIADILITAMKRLPKTTQDVLMIASCIGNVVPQKLLTEFFLALRHSEDERKCDKDSPLSLTTMNVDEAMDPARGARIVYVVTNDTDSSIVYKWSHDRLLQAAQSMIPESQLLQIHWYLGTVMLKQSAIDEHQSDLLVFMAADHMNNAQALRRVYGDVCNNTEEGSDNIDLALLNLKAGNLAIVRSAFFRAAELFRHGVDNLACSGSATTRSGWETNYDLCLNLHTRLLEMYVLIGEIDNAKSVARIVLENARNLDDKHRTRYALVEVALRERGDYAIARAMLLEMLRDYGFRIPKNPSRFFLRLQTQALLNSDLESFLELPDCSESDFRFNNLMQVFAKAENWSMAGHKFKLGRAVSIRAIKCCAKEGKRHPALGVFFLDLAHHEKERGHMAGAIHLSELAVKLLNMYPKSLGSYHSIVYGRTYHSVLPALRPIHEVMNPCLEAYKTGILVGDLEFAVAASLAYSMFYICIGLPLNPLIGDLHSFGKECYQFGKQNFGILFDIMRQTVLILRDGSDTPVKIYGEAFDEDTVIVGLKGTTTFASTMRDLSTFRLILCCIFGDIDVCERSVDIVSSYPLQDLLEGRLLLRITWLGLAAANVWHVKKSKRHLIALRRAIKYMKVSATRGNVNAHPILLMLLAEETPGQQNYDRAITACGRSGHIHYQAYMNERACRYLSEKNDPRAADYLFRAQQLYLDWGCDAKAELLAKVIETETSGGSELSSSLRVTTSTLFRARSRQNRGSGIEENMKPELSLSLLSRNQI